MPMLSKAITSGGQIDAVIGAFLVPAILGALAFGLGWVVGPASRAIPSPREADPSREIPRPQSPVRSSSVTGRASATADQSSTFDNSSNEQFERAFVEVESGERDLGLWARCFAACDGEDAPAKAMYIRERVVQLQRRQFDTEAEQAEQREAEIRLKRASVAEVEKAFVRGGKLTDEDVRLLITAAEVDIGLARSVSYQGDSLLHWAARLGLAAESSRLLKIGLDPCAVNARSLKPYDLAPTAELRELLQPTSIVRFDQLLDRSGSVDCDLCEQVLRNAGCAVSRTSNAEWSIQTPDGSTRSVYSIEALARVTLRFANRSS